MDDKIKWITSLEQIATADEASLRRTLITCDGSGTKIKQVALNELLKRVLTEETKNKLTFEINHPGEKAAGIVSYRDVVHLILESGNPGGEPDEFKQYIRACLEAWFDGASVKLKVSNGD